VKFIKKPTKKFEEGYCYISCTVYCGTNSGCVGYCDTNSGCIGYGGTCILRVIGGLV
jgi:Cys-rich peptide (Clo7bot family)